MDVTERFSDRVSDYVKYRPGYPGGIVGDLEKCGILFEGAVVADVGSGTGIFARGFLERGYRVVGVEPNEAMRVAGVEYLKGFSKFESVRGTAEGTGLGEGSVDLVVAAQAFHWFDVPRAKGEFWRILRGEKWVGLVWNERLVEGSGYLREYERLLKAYSPEYERVDHKKVTEVEMRGFLGEGMKVWVYGNSQRLDDAGMRGRAMSSSYMPKLGERGHEEIMAGLGEAFAKYAVGGVVEIVYETKVYVGNV